MQKAIFLLLFFVSALAHAQIDFDVLHYKFDLELSDASDRIRGKATIRIRALETLPSFDLDLSKEKNGKGMKVERVATIEGRPLKFGFAADRLTVCFSPALKTGEEREVVIAYSGVPADGLIISKNKYGDRSFFADNWPNRAHFWIPCRDVPNDKASFEFVVTAPSGYDIISNGVKIEDTSLSQNLKRTHWKTSIALPTKVMVIGAARFAVKEYADSPTGIPVTAWVYRQDSTAGFHDYSVAPEILKFFSAYIAPYPYEKLANVQSKTIFGGMENASAIFYAENSVTGKGKAEDLLAHEIAHQWFGDMASEKSFAHLWLSEGFATYFTDIYLEKKYGREAFKERLQKERDEVIAFARVNNHPVVDSLSPYMDLLNPNSYQKGGWVLHMLRNEVGDSAFHKIIKAYYQQYKGANADTRDFQRVAEAVSGRDLNWFFEQWLYRPGIPRLEMETKVEDGTFFLYVKQKSQPYRFPLEMILIDEDGTMIRERFEVREKESEFQVPVKGTKVSFTIDPDVKLLYEMK